MYHIGIGVSKCIKYRVYTIKTWDVDGGSLSPVVRGVWALPGYLLYPDRYLSYREDKSFLYENNPRNKNNP